MYVQIFVKHVLGNVNDILIWTIVKDVHRYVEDVLKNVVKCESIFRTIEQLSEQLSIVKDPVLYAEEQ